MKIDRINIYKVNIPFTGDYSISRKKGLMANNVVVQVVSRKEGVKGHGEGAPIEFVTGETQEGTVSNALNLIQKGSFPWKLEDVSQIWDFVDSLGGGMESNAAVCAVETALLDILGRYKKKYITDFFNKDFYTDTVHYGATLSLGDKQRITELCELIKGLQIKDLRIKLDKDFKRNKEAFEIVSRILGNGFDLRIDPNSIWDLDLAIKHIPLIKEYNVKVVEEPMMPNNPGFSEFMEIMKGYGITLMACESASTLDNVERIIREGYYKIINVKLNRNGGFRKSFRIIELIRKNNLSFQIGCTLGESGILSAAGRALCLLCSDAVYYDGSYDRFLLEKNITKEDVSFGPAGKAGPLTGYGLGVEVSDEYLEQLCDSSAITGMSTP